MRSRSLASRERPIGVLVEIDMGQNRTGVTDPEAAVRLARRASEKPNLRYRGVQAYYGHLQHVPTLRRAAREDQREVERGSLHSLRR